MMENEDRIRHILDDTPAASYTGLPASGNEDNDSRLLDSYSKTVVGVRRGRRVRSHHNTRCVYSYQ